MSTASTIAVLVVTIGSSLALGVAHQQGWGQFGEFQQSINSAHEGCEAPIQVSSWSSGVGAQSFAHTRALVKWSQKARHHGLTYASWHNARGRDVTCNTFAHNETRCIVKGRPCQRQAEVEPEILF